MPRFPENEIISLVGTTPRYDLAESVGPDLSLGALLDDGAGGELAAMALGYGTAAGDPRLRAALAALHGVSADDVVVTVGGMHALFLLAFGLCDRGDEAVVTAPLFPLAGTVLAGVGATVRTLRLSFDDGYRVDPAALAATLTARTRLVYLATPQNPAGVAVARETIRAILTAMADRCPAARLVLDETYREAAYGDDAVAPSAVDLDPRVVSCASLSKCHGAPGLRLGWAITRDAALRAQLVTAKFNTVIACSTVDEALALRALERRDRILDERRRRLADGLARTAAWVAGSGGRVAWVRPDAGALCCVRLSPALFDDGAVARFYDELAAEGVRVAPGAWFGEEDRVFRLGFGLLPTAELEAALAILSDGLDRALRGDGAGARLSPGDVAAPARR